MTSCSATGGHPAGLAFDSLAETYDDTFTHSLIGRAQRDAIWNIVRQTFKPGDHILELNCGTGEDALFLARIGASVFACDASERMISVAGERHAREAPQSLLRFEALAIERIGELQYRHFDGVFSNFSGLNCVADIGAVAQQLSALVKPGARMLLCLSSRICLWESLWFLTRAQPGRAFRRWKGHTVATLGGFTVAVQYPTLRALRKLFSPFFVLRSCIGIGVAVPPSYLEPWARNHEGVLNGLRAVDTVISRWPGLRAIGDHMLLSFERAPS
jgi:ubiquinone/menaquinone biosynthesis C-methylase UbiE